MAVRSKKWDERRRRALEVSESIASKGKQHFPVDLGRVAEACLVKRIQFRPMVVDAALGVIRGGFEIFVRCLDSDERDLNERFAAAPDGSTLPQQLRSKARFSIAHELAHTLFYDCESATPTMTFSTADSKTAQTLERACNLIAGAILLPKPLLEFELRTTPLYRPEDFSRLAEKTLVARATLVKRLSNFRSQFQPPAIILSVGFDGARNTIEAVWRHYALDEMFTRLQPGNFVEESLGDCTPWRGLRVLGGSADEIEWDAPVAHNKERWRLAVEVGAGVKAKSSYLVTLWRPRDVRNHTE